MKFEKLRIADFVKGGHFYNSEAVDVILVKDFQWADVSTLNDWLTTEDNGIYPMQKMNKAFQSGVLVFKRDCDVIGVMDGNEPNKDEIAHDIVLVVPIGTKGSIRCFKSGYYFMPDCYDNPCDEFMMLNINMAFFLPCVKLNTNLCRTCIYGSTYPQCTKAHSPKYEKLEFGDNRHVVDCDGYTTENESMHTKYKKR